MIAWDPRIVLVHVDIAPAPIVEPVRADPQPADEPFGQDLRLIAPAPGEADELREHMMQPILKLGDSASCLVVKLLGAPLARSRPSRRSQAVAWSHR